MFEWRSTALLVWSEISIQTTAHNASLLLIGLSRYQPPAKKQYREKRKANSEHEEEKRKRKWQDSWKWTASGEEHLWFTNDEVKSSIGDHRTSLNAQPSSWRELRTRKGPLCIDTASRLRRQRRTQAKLMVPDLWSRLRNSWERRCKLPNSGCFC